MAADCYGMPTAADREKMIESHLSLVDFLVDRMIYQMPSFVNRDDLRSAAMLGLLDAANRYDPRRGVLFKTFAERRIRGAVYDEVRRMDWFTRSMREKQSRVRKAVSELENRLQREPGDDEIAAEMDLELEEYRELQRQVSQLGCVSLDQNMGEDKDGQTFLDALADETQTSAQERIEKKELTAELAGYLSSLSQKEQLVLSLFYYEELSQKEISEVMELTEGRISQLHSQALRKMRGRMQRSLNLYHRRGG